MKAILTIMAAMAATLTAGAEIVMPDIFSDNMVLQQNCDAKIWGYSNPGAKITVKPCWSKKTVSTQSDREGRWELSVATPAASFEPQYISIKGDGSEVELKNVLIGEVWFCSGQSNMEMPLKGFWSQHVENAGRAIAYSGRYPGIRAATVERRGDYTVQKTANGKWVESNPANAGDFSAVAYFFARSLTDVLDVPVGIINCSLGGSRVEAWMPKWKLDTYPDCDVELEKQTPDSILHLWERINVMYNAMLAPVAGYTVKGFLWNQGEANVGRHADYPARLADMVDIWRKEWRQEGEMPFYMVEIPAWSYGNPDGSIAAFLREAQHKAAAIIPSAGIVSTSDLVYPHEVENIHASKKEEIGERLAWLAAGRTYGIAGMVNEYPVFRALELKDSAAVVHLDNVENGLSPDAFLEGFEVAGDDKVFHPARAVELKYCRAVEVRCDSVPNIKAVRYCFKNFAIGKVHNHKGLPLIPFRTDDWNE